MKDRLQDRQARGGRQNRQDGGHWQVRVQGQWRGGACTWRACPPHTAPVWAPAAQGPNQNNPPLPPAAHQLAVQRRLRALLQQAGALRHVLAADVNRKLFHLSHSQLRRLAEAADDGLKGGRGEAGGQGGGGELLCCCCGGRRGGGRCAACGERAWRKLRMMACGRGEEREGRCNGWQALCRPCGGPAEGGPASLPASTAPPSEGRRRHLRRLPAHLGVHPLLHKGLALLEELGRQQHHGGGAVANLKEHRGGGQGQLGEGSGGDKQTSSSAAPARRLYASILCNSTLCRRLPALAPPRLHVTRAGRNRRARGPAPQRPAPTSASCASEMSTRVLAAGCTMSRVFMMVAPSLETVTARSVCMSLSMPRGPSVVRTTSATA